MKNDTIQKKIERLVQSSKLGLTPVKVIHDIAQLSLKQASMYIKLNDWDVFSADWVLNGLSEYRDAPQDFALLVEIAKDYIEMVDSNPPFTDVFELIGFPNQKLAIQLGQFLTPSKVATGAAKFIEVSVEDKPIFISDCGGCGAGSLLLAPLRTIYEDTPARLNLVHLQAVDIDPKMVLLTACQIVIPCIRFTVPLGSLFVHRGHGIIDYRYYVTNDPKTLSYVFTSDLKGLYAYMETYGTKVSELEGQL
ncbi:DNA methyltransferase family protein [Diaphorobacter aerolatus]|uniref:DNA methylase adenine-specific domain-containing protein n=1 Tax=Diaphorobacter aerolatus TaxID=1288495 RepID=A0A7H0GJC2_9BURK|nr:hypothetical protein [Diaphorobacter aerolatus]QNP48388.1 hypothetical protein H9K75_20935 [Diaphorobacter aerolatus]